MSWTFITNHGAVLAMIGQHKTITAREMAGELNITERSVLRIISDLENEGYIVKVKEGRTNRYEIHETVPLRRQDQRHVDIGDLLKVLSHE